MSIIIALDGVLRNEKKERINEGFKLYLSLVETNRVVLATDSFAAEADRWCRLQGIVGYAEILDNSVEYEGVPLRIRQVEMARAEGGRLELVVEGDVSLAPKILEMGVPVLLLATPRPAKKDFAIRPWGDITTELERQQERLAGLVPKLEHWE